MDIVDKLSDIGYEYVVLLEEFGIDEIIGVDSLGRVVYDYDKLIDWLVLNDGCTAEEAEDYIQYSVIGSAGNYGDAAPIIMRRIIDSTY